MKYYIALTAGPLIATINNTKRTRELWAASYSFSYLMKKIAKKMKDGKRVFILPNTVDMPPQNDGVARYPDKLIIESSVKSIDADFKALKKAVDDTLTEFGKSVASHFKRQGGDKAKNEVEDKKEEQVIIQYCKDYFQFYGLRKELADGVNPILDLSMDIDALDLQRNFALEHKRYLDVLFKIRKATFLIEDGFERGFISYDSILDIATAEFEGRSSMVSDEEFRKLLEEGVSNTQIKDYDKKRIELLKNDPKFKSAHKYIAIVHADGDSVGAHLGRLTTTEQWLGFSAKLIAFSGKAIEMIKGFGGMSVYAGGDDLLFFAPIIYKGGSVFKLLEELNKEFSNTLDDKNVSLSFGVSISYYKFPMGEALEISRDLLLKHAKKVKDKNAVSFRVLKHSGSEFGTDIKMGTDFYNCTSALLKAAIDNDNLLLHSVMYKIKQNEELFAAIGHDKDRVRALVDNSFNEKIHKENVHKKEFLDSIKLLIPAAFEAVKTLASEIKEIKGQEEKLNKKRAELEDKLKKEKEQAIKAIYSVLTKSIIYGKYNL
jgi:CRISPR-associated protein Cmr2